MNGRRSLAFALATVALLLVAAPATAASPSSDFTGSWTSVDTDGSSQTLKVSSGATPTVVYQDFYASGCDTFAGPATHWTAAGEGSISGDTMNVAFHKSGCGTFLQGGYEDMYVYDEATDTLVDAFGITWFRM